MSNITFVADVFAEQHLGGGELSNQELIRLLRVKGHTVKEVFSAQLTTQMLKDASDEKYIVGNFLGLNEEVKKFLENNCKYVIYEHDHKYLASRDPSIYENFIAPDDQVVNKGFYTNALAVFCQSKLHKDVAQKNLKLDNILSVSGNLWDDDTLTLLREMSDKDKLPRYSIWDSMNPIKNTALTIAYCERNKIPYDPIGLMPYRLFIETITNNDTFIFLPQTLETLCRVAVECRMAGMKVITNKKIGASSEEWFKLKGKDLIDYMAEKKHMICSLVEEKLNEY